MLNTFASGGDDIDGDDEGNDDVGDNTVNNL